MRPLAVKSSTIEGTNPSLAIVDEYHLHPDNSVYSALEQGQGARPEGLLFAITTAGSNTISACMLDRGTKKMQGRNFMAKAKQAGESKALATAKAVMIATYQAEMRKAGF